MNPASRDVEIKAANEVAEAFVASFYRAVNAGTALSPLYVSSTDRYAGLAADISVNGLVLDVPAAYEALLASHASSDGVRARYEVESVDAHILNPDFALGDVAAAAAIPKLARASVLVQVTGRVRYGAERGRDAAPQANFNEVFVLVPNWDAVGRNAPRNARRLLILSQNFRTL